MQPLVHYHKDVDVGIVVTLEGERVLAIKQELAAFDAFAKEQLGEPLAKPETAIVATYIAWKLGLDKRQEQENGEKTSQ